MNELDEYDVFLQTWEPDDLLVYSTLDQNINDPFIRSRLAGNSSGNASVQRAPWLPGHKVMTNEEVAARAYNFFQSRQASWAEEFEDYVLSRGVPEEKLGFFIKSFAGLWVDGKKRRQDSIEMRSIKVSIRDFDLVHHAEQAGCFVINPADDADNSAQPLFTVTEMEAIFEANSGLVEALLPEYMDFIRVGALDDLYVRRGVLMPAIDKVLRELNYLSSYSLALGPVEQFAQTATKKTKNCGFSCIFSAPISAVQHRIVAFAPFIEGMDLSQMELVVAPPIEEVILQDDGLHGEIHDFSFK